MPGDLKSLAYAAVANLAMAAVTPSLSRGGLGWGWVLARVGRNRYCAEWNSQEYRPTSHHRPGFGLPPLSAPLTKIKLKQQKRGEFFAAHPAGSISGVSGMSGCVFFGYFLCRIDKESD